MLRIGFAGSATDPSHLGHEEVLWTILTSDLFDLVFWYPSGFSKFKPNLLVGIHRQQLAQLAFPQEWIYSPNKGWAKFMLDLSATMVEDVPTAYRFLMLKQQYPGASVTFVTGSDAVTANENGVLPISNWVLYQEQLRSEQILIIPRSGFAVPGDLELPDKMLWLSDEVMQDIRSSEIRRLIAAGDPTWRKMVNPKVEQYIDLHQLYLPKEAINGSTL